MTIEEGDRLYGKYDRVHVLKILATKIHSDGTPLAHCRVVSQNWPTQIRFISCGQLSLWAEGRELLPLFDEGMAALPA